MSIIGDKICYNIVATLYGTDDVTGARFHMDFEAHRENINSDLKIDTKFATLFKDNASEETLKALALQIKRESKKAINKKLSLVIADIIDKNQ